MISITHIFCLQSEGRYLRNSKLFIIRTCTGVSRTSIRKKYRSSVGIPCMNCSRNVAIFFDSAEPKISAFASLISFVYLWGVMSFFQCSHKLRISLTVFQRFDLFFNITDNLISSEIYACIYKRPTNQIEPNYSFHQIQRYILK